MQSFLLKFGALAAIASTVSADNIHIETTHPSANRYKSHCTVIIEDPIDGCSGSSQPFPQGCGGNRGVKTAPICNNKTVKVDWHDGLLQLLNADNSVVAHCTLESTGNFGKCDTNDPDKYPPPVNAGAEALEATSFLYGLAPLAAGMLL